MLTLLATIVKELRQLSRDRAGLVVLFGMPMILVLIVSLVQDNVLKATGEADVRVIVVNMDDGAIGKALVSRLQESAAIELVTELNGIPATRENGRQALNDGLAQFCIVVPSGTSAAVHRRARAEAETSIVNPGTPRSLAPPESMVPLELYFDPTIRGAMRSMMLAQLERLALALELRERTTVFGEMFPGQMKKALRAQLGEDLDEDDSLVEIPELRLDWGRPIMALEEHSSLDQMPNSVQQNVPAWSLFGMFFIVVPLGGSLIRERQQGTFARLYTMPVSMASVFLGKVLAFVLICQLQFVLMLLVGVVVLPLFGAPGLALSSGFLPLAGLSLSSALAATGFGIFIGAWSRSYEQASMLGATSVVIAAAMGGIMVPIFVMPPAMRTLSRFSPLAWAHQGFMEVFLREGRLAAVMPNILWLLGFFAGCMGLACFSLFRRGQAQAG